ncbi:MAG: response regulator transcription factor, partial [Spirochaetota bacterium]
CLAIRTFATLPVLMLTALGDEVHEIRGIDIGADDYLPKPFSRDLLRARVRALLRRGRREAPELISAGALVLDAGSREVSVEGIPVSLSFREFELLRFLLRNRNQVCPRERIIDQVWGYLYDGDPRTLDTHIKSLRQKLGETGTRITTQRNVGYAWKDARG